MPTPSDPRPVPGSPIEKWRIERKRGWDEQNRAVEECMFQRRVGTFRLLWRESPRILACSVSSSSFVSYSLYASTKRKTIT